MNQLVKLMQKRKAGMLQRLSCYSSGITRGCIFLALAMGTTATCNAQLPNAQHGEVVPRDVRDMYDRGLQYLARTQSTAGNWTSGETGPGATGLGLMDFPASGEDPNFGI